MFEHGWMPPTAWRAALIDQQWDRYAHIHRGDDQHKAALDAVVARLLGSIRSS